MPSYNYKCECGNVQEEIHSYKLVTNDENDFAFTLICSSCGKKGLMKRLISVPNFGKYSSASTEEKREILKKRSKDHFKKNIEDKFHQMNKPDYMP